MGDWDTFSFPDPIVSLSRREHCTRKQRVLKTLDLQSQILGLPEFIYESSIVLNMVALRNMTSEESICEAQSDPNLENVSLRIERKEATCYFPIPIMQRFFFFWGGGGFFA